MRILVVDDEEDVNFLFRQKFRREIKSGEYSFSFAHNALDGLKFLDELEPFDVFLVLSDINMPGMSGLEMVKEINIRRPDLTVFMVSAYDDNENHKASVENGASGFLTKPVDFDALKVLLEKHSSEKKKLNINS